MTPHVVVTLPLPASVLEELGRSYRLSAWSETGPMPDTTLQSWAADADAILCSLGTPITATLLANSPRLQTISSISVGVDHIDLGAATRAGLPVGHTPDVLVDSTADMAVALMLSVMRRIVEADRFVRAGGERGPLTLYLLAVVVESRAECDRNHLNALVQELLE